MATDENISPWRSAILTYVAPGLGLWTLGKRWLALIAFVSVIGAGVYGMLQIYKPEGNTAVGVVYAGAALVLYGFLIVQPILGTLHFRRHNEEPATNRRKDPFLALGLSFIIPGFGQFYVREYAGGAFFLLWYLVMRFAVDSSWLGVIVQISCAASSYLAAKRATQFRHLTMHGIIWVLVLLYSSDLVKDGLWSYFRNNVVTSGRGIGDSMEPTLSDGDRVLLKVNPNRLERGDIVCLDMPQFDSLIGKRLVAFGGESVEIRGGRVLVNGNPLISGRFSEFHTYSDSTTSFAHENVPYTVPAGNIFVLGDNPHHSLDSRNFGAVPIEQVVGVDYKIIWPASRRRTL